MKFSRIEDVERRLFFYICGFSFFLPLSKAVGNIFLALSLLGLAHRLILKRDDILKPLREYRKIFCVIGILLLAVLISALSADSVLPGLKRFADRYIYHISAMLPVFLVRFEREKILLFGKLLLAGVFLSNVSVIIQALPRLSDEYWRFGGVMPMMTQASLIAMFLPIYALLFMRFKQRRARFLILTAIVVALTAILFNGTRGAWLAIFIVVPLVVLIYSKHKLKSFATVAIIFVAIGGIFLVTPHLSNRLATLTDMGMQSNAERMKMWTSALNMFEDHPILGVGYGQYATAYQTQYILPTATERQQAHAHNNIIQMLAECGIVGAAAFIFMWIYFSYFSLRGWFKDDNFAYLLFFCVLSGLMFHGLTEFNFETSVTSKVLWYSLGLCLAYCQVKD